MANPGVILSADSLRQLQTRIRSIPRPAGPGASGGAPAPWDFTAKITGYTGDVYQWTMQTPDPDHPGKYVDRTGVGSTTITGSYAHELNGSTNVSNGTIVMMTRLVDDRSGNAHYVFTGGATTGLIPVTLAPDGGANGSKTTQATWTYQNPVNASTGMEIMHADGTTPWTGLHPKLHHDSGGTRLDFGRFLQATQGTGFIDGSGNFILWYADETAYKGNCP